jgi:hypothetical protein
MRKYERDKKKKQKKNIIVSLSQTRHSCIRQMGLTTDCVGLFNHEHSIKIKIKASCIILQVQERNKVFSEMVILVNTSTLTNFKLRIVYKQPEFAIEKPHDRLYELVVAGNKKKGS